jgi:hypothetical protein
MVLDAIRLLPNRFRLVGSDDGFVYAIEGTRHESPRAAVYWDDELGSRSALGSQEENRAVVDHLSDGLRLRDPRRRCPV